MNTIDVTEIFTMAESGALEAAGLQKVPLREDCIFEDRFPDEPFVLRGAAASEIFSWSDRLTREWKGGACDGDEFVRRQNASRVTFTSGEHLPGFSNSRTISFELGTSVLKKFAPHPSLYVHSTASIAALGAWFTPPHIEWGGGESVAALISGKKLWIFSTTPQSTKDFFLWDSYSTLLSNLRRSLSSRTKSRKGFYTNENLLYHIGQPGDLIVQPAFAMHCVVTKPLFDGDQPLWALVTGYEGIDIRLENHARRVFFHFVLEKKRSELLAEAKYHNFVALVRLLKVDVYRKAEDKCRNSGDSLENLLDYYEEPNYLTHMRKLLEAGYDVDSSLENSTETNFQIAKERKRVKLDNFGPRASSSTDSVWSSSLTKMTPTERERWSRLSGVVQDIENI